MPETIERRLRIVTNVRAGGYWFSPAATREIARRKGLKLREELGHLFVDEGYDRVETLVPRDDPDLIAVVEEMGEAASGDSCELRVGTYVQVASVEMCDDGSERVVGWLQEVRDA